MITDNQKKIIVDKIIGMADDQIYWFKDFMEDERSYIMHLIKIQTGEKFFEIETNGTSENPSTITKFRKLNHWWKKKKLWEKC